MRVPSRYMPTYKETLTMESHIVPYIFLFVLVGWLVYTIWKEPYLGLFISGMILVIFLISSMVGSSLSNTMEKLIKERSNEDIGTFTRSLNYRNIDTWIIRAVYEEISNELGYDKPLPIRPSDNLEKDLKLDDEDLEYILTHIFARVEISVENIEKNLYYGKIETVGDIIHFCNYQPKKV